jgi:hypothetical protein
VVVAAEIGLVVVLPENHTAAVDDEVGGVGAAVEIVEGKVHRGNGHLVVDFAKAEGVVVAVWIVAVPVGPSQLEVIHATRGDD